MNIGIIGVGTVGEALIKNIEKNKELIKARCGKEIEVIKGVVRDLNKKTDIIAEQSYSERQLFEKAYNRLKSELEVVLGEKAQQKIFSELAA